MFIKGCFSIEGDIVYKNEAGEKRMWLATCRDYDTAIILLDALWDKEYEYSKETGEYRRRQE